VIIIFTSFLPYLLTYLLTYSRYFASKESGYIQFMLIVAQRADYTSHFMDVLKEGTIFLDDGHKNVHNKYKLHISQTNY